jgi:hypothetical protein
LGVTSYTHTTFSNSKAFLANRLGDAGKVYWSDTELGLYIIEALRTWGWLTAYWRDYGQFVTSSGQAYYDITSVANADGDALLTYTITDSDIVELIQYHFIEPATGTSWNGSEQFTFSDLTQAIERRRNQFLIDTACVLTRTYPIAVDSPPASNVYLGENVGNIRHLTWRGISASNSLVPEDISRSRNTGSDSLLTPNAYPLAYISSLGRPTEITLVPPTNEPGVLDLLSVSMGATLNPATGVALGIPDDMASAVKWGAMADLLGRDGPGRDMPRAYYCERKYKLGVELAKTHTIVTNVSVNGILVHITSLTDLDRYDPSWITSSGSPSIAAPVANFVVLKDVPDDIYSIGVDVVRKAVVPSLDIDYLQIGKEYLDSILDYAQHLASFKMGGMEFKSTFRASDNFYDAALAYNTRLSAKSPNIVSLMRSSTNERDTVYNRSGSLGSLQKPAENYANSIQQNN